MPESYFAQVLSPDFLVWKIVNLGRKFSVCSKLNLSLYLTPECMYARLGPRKKQTKLVCDSLTWDQALFSFRFENYIPAGMAKRK